MNTFPVRRTLIIASIFLIQFLTVYDLALMFAIGPTLAQRFGIPAENIAILHTGYFFVGIAVPLFGTFSRRFGLLRAIMFGCICYAGGMIGIALSETSITYAASKLLVGFSYSLILAMMPNYVLIILGDNRATQGGAILKFSFAIAFFIAPFSGYRLYTIFGPQTLYLLLAGLMVFSCSLLLLVSDRSRTQQNRRESPRPMRSTRIKTLLLIVMAILSPAPILFVSNYYSVYLSDLGVDGQKISIYYTVMGVGSIFSALFILFLSSRWGKRKSTNLGLAISTLSLVGIMYPEGIILYLALFLFYFGYDLFTGLMYVVSALRYPEQRELLIPMMAMGVSIGMVTTNYLAKIVYTHLGFSVNVLLGALCMIICIVISKLTLMDPRPVDTIQDHNSR